MIERLEIRNLVLIDQCTIFFDQGLNILTGETGSGKSVVLSALQLLRGARTDTQLIGTFSDIAVIEADLRSIPLPEDLFPSSEGAVRVRREIHRSGRSRAFINDQQVSLSSLKEIIYPLIEITDQATAHKLFEAHLQRGFLDQFANTSVLAKAFRACFTEKEELQNQIHALLELQSHRDQTLRWAEKDLEMIEEVNWTEEEEKELNEKHALLAHTQDVFHSIEQVEDSLEAHTLKQALRALQNAVKWDSSLTSSMEALSRAIYEIEETQRTLLSYKGKLDLNPQNLQATEERLAQFERLKRRFGNRFEVVELQRKKLQEQIESLRHLEEKLEALQHECESQSKKAEQFALNLSKARKEAATVLSSQVTQELRELNLPFAEFSVQVMAQPMSPTGIDHIQFFFSANPNHVPLPIEKCASGGELSRILLALEIQLTDQKMGKSLVFDEIDSNVGGHSATILAQKLRDLSKGKQIITITHFTQVAKQASAHFLVRKESSTMGVRSSVIRLSDSERESEYQRMQGTPTENFFLS